MNTKLNQISHLAKEVSDTIKGNSYTISNELQQERLAHCKCCDELNRFLGIRDKDADIGLADTCKACGCLVRAKTTRSEQYCPLGKWGKVD
jgi:hypothetical protein